MRADRCTNSEEEGVKPAMFVFIVEALVSGEDVPIRDSRETLRNPGHDSGHG